MKRRQLPALLAVLALAACADPGSVTTASVSPRFQLVAVAPSSSGTELPGMGATPGPVYGPATLTVSLKGVLPSLRRVLAVEAIEEVVVTLRMEDGSGLEVERRVDRAALQAGQTTVIFTGMPEGRALIEIEARGAAQRSLGWRRFTVEMRGASSTHLDVALTGILGGRGGSGGGASSPVSPSPSPSAPSGLITEVALADSEVINGVAPGTILNRVDGFEALGSVQVTPDGAIWAMTKQDGSYAAVRFGADGAVTKTVAGGDAAGITGQGFGVDSRGHLWLIDGAAKKLSHFDENGSLVGSVSLTRGVEMAIDAVDQVWVTDQQDVVQVSPLGQVVARHPLGGAGGLVRIASNGGLYVGVNQPFTGGELAKLSPTGAVDWRHVALGWNYRTGQPALDGEGHLWLPLSGARQIARVTPEGEVIMRIDVPIASRRVWVADDSMLWVGTDASLMKVTATGEVLGDYRGAGGPVSVAFDAQGRLWAAHGGTLSQMAP